MNGERIELWADRLESMLGTLDGTPFDRVMVVAQTNSTQDAARMQSARRAGLVLVAGRQVGGRGRLGRAWADDQGLGIAATFVVDPRVTDQGVISLGAGLAACAVAERATARTMGLRWPNDVVDPHSGRKIAGILVEVVDDLAYVGIGINVRQGQEDWDPALADRACSLMQLGAGIDRITAVAWLMNEFASALRCSSTELVRQWEERNVLAGTMQEIVCDGERSVGRVEAIDPSASVVLRCEDGSMRRLPAMQSSLVHR